MSDKKPSEVFFCSTLAAVICNCFTNPLDVIKVRLQDDSKKCSDTHHSICGKRRSPIPQSSSPNISLFHLILTRNIEACSSAKCECLPFKTNTKALVYLVRKEGLSTLANGLTQGVFASTISAVTFLTFYESIRKEIAKYTSSSVLVPLIGAFLARSATTTLIFPFEYWRTVQQSVKGSFRASSVKISNQFHSGFSSLLLRDIVFACINWVLFENIRFSINITLSDDPSTKNRSYKNQKILLVSNFFSGAIAGGIGSYCSIPFDVVKTRKQLHPNEYRKKSVMQILREIYEAEGRKGLFNGARQRGWKVTFQTAGTLTLYELWICSERKNA